MSYIYSFDITEFPNNMVHAEIVNKEITVVMPSGVVYEGSVIGDSVANFYFEDSLSPTDSGTLSSVVAGHAGYKLLTKFVASSKMVEREFEVTATGTELVDWDIVGGTTTNVSFFLEDLTQAVGNVVGEIKVVGSGAEFTVVSKPPLGTTTDHLTAHYFPSDTGGNWIPFNFTTNVPPISGPLTYCILGRIPSSGTSASLRFTSMTMLQVYPEYGITP
jgi:hypothetical protein